MYHQIRPIKHETRWALQRGPLHVLIVNQVFIIRIEQSNTPLYCLTLTSDYMFRSHDHHQVYTYHIGPNGVS
jgi:hypothetical protein